MIEVDADDADRLRGRIRPVDGEPVEFTGTLELLAGIERMRPSGTAPRGEPANDGTDRADRDRPNTGDTP